MSTDNTTEQTTVYNGADQAGEMGEHGTGTGEGE